MKNTPYFKEVQLSVNMVEAINTNADVKNDEFVPSDEEKTLIKTHLGEEAMVDGKHKANVVLTKDQAMVRASLIQEVEYDFSLALKKGDYYLGNAVINFYLKRVPGDDELFINTQAMAIADLYINLQKVTDKEAFDNQRINMKSTQLVKGWNTVEVKYLTPYNKNRVGLHTFTDLKD